MSVCRLSAGQCRRRRRLLSSIAIGIHFSTRLNRSAQLNYFRMKVGEIFFGKTIDDEKEA